MRTQRLGSGRALTVLDELPRGAQRLGEREIDHCTDRARRDGRTRLTEREARLELERATIREREREANVGEGAGVRGLERHDEGARLARGQRAGVHARLAVERDTGQRGQLRVEIARHDRTACRQLALEQQRQLARAGREQELAPS